MLATCPRCHKNLESHKVIGDMAICDCGWTGSINSGSKKKSSLSFKQFNQFSSKKKVSSKSFVKFGILALTALIFGYGAKEWKGQMVHRAFYNIKSSVKLNSAADEFRMAVICHKLQKQDCKVTALANAFKKDPKNVDFNGEYAISLTESGKHEQAILAFQRFFSQTDGTWRHKMNFAESLGQREYTNDAKEWFYKAIKENPENLKISEAMIKMLTRAHQYGEALSIIGHFNMTMPRTQHVWHNLAIQIKTEFKEYQEKYAIKEMTLSQLGNYYFAPAIVSGALDIQLFLVSPNTVYTTVDMNYLKNNNIAYETKGKIEVNANGGQAVAGTKIVLPSLIFGAFTLTNVEAVACENCAFMAGKSILGKLNIQTSQVTNTSVHLLSMKEK